MVLVTPCTDWYLAFTARAGGDVAANLALLPWNLLLQIALLPAYLHLLTRALVVLDWSLIGRSLLLYVLLPLGLAQAARRLLPRLEARIGAAQVAALALLVAAMFAAQGSVLVDQPTVLARMIAPVALFIAAMAGLAWGAAQWMDMGVERAKALACTTAARNSPLTLSLALVFFPGAPLVALSQVVEPLIELPLLVLLAAGARRLSVAVEPAGHQCGQDGAHPQVEGPPERDGAVHRRPGGDAEVDGEARRKAQ